jgi:hypothetical protein
MEHPSERLFFLAFIIVVGISEQFYIELRAVLITFKVLITKDTVDSTYISELVMQSLQQILIMPYLNPVI